MQANGVQQADQHPSPTDQSGSAPKLLQAAYVLFLAFVFLFPLSLTTAGVEISFFGSAIFLFALGISRRTTISFYSPLIHPLWLFGAWSLVTVFFALDKPYSWHDFVSHYLRYLLLYLLTVNLIDTERKISILAWVLIASTSLFCIGALVNEYLVLNIEPSKRFGLKLVETPTNLIGVVTLFAMILSTRLFADESGRQRRIALIVMVVPMLLVTILTQTRSNFVAMFVLVPILFYRKRKLLISLIVLLLIIVFASPVKNRLRVGGSIRHRISLIHLSIEVIKDYPITGIGFGINTMADHRLIPPEKYNARVAAQHRLADEHFNWPHNMMLSIAVRTGLVGLALYCLLLAVCGYLLVHLIRAGRTAFIRNWSVCILAGGMMFFVKGNLEPIFSKTPETILFLILSLTAVLWRMNNAARAHPSPPAG